jgi:predicted ATPase/DNA-binding winged helix-turn-helix (wHTH) protein
MEPVTEVRNVIYFGPFSLFAAERLLKKGEEPIPLGGRALDILIALAERAGEVVTHKELLSSVWPDVTVEEANLRFQMGALRKALGDGRDGARYISNVAGRGYCFVASVTRSSTRQTVPVTGITSTERVKKLPPRPARMVGRDDTVRSLAQQLQMWRLVSIVGSGGVGKTTVAISVAHTLANRFHDAVFFVDLAALTDPQLVPTAVASALGLMVQTPQDPVVGLLAFIGDRKILLVLDNCDHVIGVAAALAERVVSEAPQAHILATSREALRVESEHVHLLYSLECPPEDADLTATEALRYPAAQLFMERAAASGHGAALSEIDAPIVARICRRLDGIALAIELAASRVGPVGIRGTAELLDNRFSLLWQGRRTALPRHETLNAMLDWSYSLLSEPEKVVLCRLSVFVGNFTRQTAGSVASETEADEADVIDAVASLVAKSLISTTVVNESTYYRLLDTTRAYAAAKLAERGEADCIARRHAVFYATFLEHDEIIQSFGEYDLSGYTPHIGNVRAALRWALSERGDAPVGIELATWAAPLFFGLSLLEECRGWCERALAALDDASRGTRQEMILQQALALSSMFTRGNSDQVRSAIQSGLALAETLEDRPRQLCLLAGLNFFLMRLGDIRGALAVAEQADVIAQVAKHPVGTVWAAWWVGIAYHFLGNQAAAQLHLKRGMALAAQLGTFNTHLFGFEPRISALVCFARALWLRGFSDQALRIVQKAIDEAASRDHPAPICVSRAYAATVLLWTGDLPGASDLIEQLIAYARRYSLEPYRAAGIALKGAFAIAREEPEAGLDLLRSALETLRAQQYNLLIPGFIGALAEGLCKTGQFEEALFTVNGAIARAKNSGADSSLSELLRIKSQILAAQHDRGSAMNCLTEAIAVGREQSALALELRSTMALARLLAEDGQRGQARHTLALVYDRFTEGFETADLRLARALLEDLQ